MGSAFGEWAASHPAQSHEMNREIVQMAVSGDISPLNTLFFDLDRVPDAMAAMAARQIKGKAMVATPEFRRRYGKSDARL